MTGAGPDRPPPTAPRLSVVVCSLGRSVAADAVASIADSATRAAIEVQIILVWQACEPPPALPSGAEIVKAFPAGVSYARNRGVAAARAEIVAFVDDDARVRPSWAGAVIDAFAEGADAAVGPVGSADPGALAHGVPAHGAARWYTALDTLPWPVGDGGAFAFRRRVLDELGGFDVRLGAGSFGAAAEDAELLARLLARGGRVRWRPDMQVTEPGATAARRPATQRPHGFGAGRMVRRLRSPALAAGYGAALVGGAWAALRRRDRDRARAVAAAASGFIAGALTADRWRSPARLLERLPAEVRAALATRRLEPWPVPHRAPPHFLWAAGDDCVLHAYTGTPADWSPGIAARRAALAAGVSGVPSVVAVGADDDGTWVLEQRMPGRHPRGDQWRTAAVDWALSLTRTPGPPLHTTPWYDERRRSLPQAGAVAAALRRIGECPAVIVHGDLQRKNVLADRSGRVAILDWEQAVQHGPPGLDLLYLAICAHPPRDRFAAVRVLAAGREPTRAPILGLLRRAGLDDSGIRAALIVAVHVWAADERARRRLLGIPPQPSQFEPLCAALDG